MALIMSLLGPVQISQDDQPIQIPGYKPLALLAYLVMTGKAHTRQHLVDLLIDRSDDPRASLRYTLSELRQAIGAEYIQANREQIAFNFDTDYWLDVSAFEGGQLELYRGDFLEGLQVRDAFGFEDWAFFERERLRGVYQDALTQQLAEAESEGHDRMAVETAHTLLRLDNLREDWYRALMRAYARLGQREAAVAQYNVCRQVLAAELGIEPSAETTQLCERIQTGQAPRDESTVSASTQPAGTQPYVAQSQIDHNLPPQPTPFIGRTEELAQITRRLEDPACRLLTLTGPGGIGKTRLALQAAINLIENPAGQTMFSTGVYFVNLASVGSPDSLVTTVAEAIKFSFYSDANLRQQLLEYFRENKMLLVLDNFEHLLVSSEEKTIDLVIDILAVAPAVKIIITSREALHLQEEWLFAITGLRLPIDDEAFSLEEYSAVQLFVQCAKRASPGFSFSTEQDCVLHICRMVEGMPLAIELAAAWLRMFPCKKIAREIEHGLDLLTTSLRNVPPRHRSMHAVFEHSWSLLSDVEKQVLRQSSVFQGGFRQEAAEQVASATFADLVALVEKSLLHRTPAGRYQLHGLLRQFSAEKLQTDPGEQEAVRHRYSHYYLTFLQQRER
jgi:predicted ATPase/DNA-binding SARP family transcriptional activator